MHSKVKRPGQKLLATLTAVVMIVSMLVATGPLSLAADKGVPLPGSESSYKVDGKFTEALIGPEEPAMVVFKQSTYVFTWFRADIDAARQDALIAELLATGDGGAQGYDYGPYRFGLGITGSNTFDGSKIFGKGKFEAQYSVELRDDGNYYVTVSNAGKISHAYYAMADPTPGEGPKDPEPGDPTELIIVKRVITPDNIETETFTFDLYAGEDTTGEPLATYTITGSGTATIELDEWLTDETNTFTLVEQKGKNGNDMIYDDAVYTITVSDGKATVLLNGEPYEGAIQTNLIFTNYAKEPKIDLEKGASHSTITQGGTVKYTLTATNTGDIDLDTIVIEDNMFKNATGDYTVTHEDTEGVKTTLVKGAESDGYTIGENKSIVLDPAFVLGIGEKLIVEYSVKFDTPGVKDNEASVSAKDIIFEKPVDAEDDETVTVTVIVEEETDPPKEEEEKKDPPEEKEEEKKDPPEEKEEEKKDPPEEEGENKNPPEEDGNTPPVEEELPPNDPPEVIGEETVIPDPPTPAGDGQTLVPTEDGGYELIDEDGTPLGKWEYDPELEEWIFDEYIPLGQLPNTGAAMSLIPYFLVGATGGLVVLRARKAKREDQEQ